MVPCKCSTWTCEWLACLPHPPRAGAINHAGLLPWYAAAVDREKLEAAEAHHRAHHRRRAGDDSDPDFEVVRCQLAVCNSPLVLNVCSSTRSKCVAVWDSLSRPRQLLPPSQAASMRVNPCCSICPVQMPSLTFAVGWPLFK